MDCEHGVPEYGFCKECCREIVKKHKYFVAYSFENESGSGIANGSVDSVYPIGVKDIAMIQSQICKEHNYRNCVLINWKKFEEK